MANQRQKQQYGDVQFRAATVEDVPWLWHLYRELLKPAIDAQWGWDETFQHRQFSNHLPAELFTIAECERHAVATYALRNNATHLYLHLLLISADYQLQGLGTTLINRIKNQARQLNLPVELSTFPANPVDAFYLKNGFARFEATAEKKRFRWVAGKCS